MPINIKTPNKITKEMLSVAKNLSIKTTMITQATFLAEKNGKRVMFAGCMPESTSAISYKLTNDKYFTLKILKENNLPVLPFIKIEKEKDAIDFLNKHKSVVIKPREGIHGKGITVGITKAEKIKKAIEKAKVNDPQKRTLAEKKSNGNDYRILVIGKKNIFCLNRIPAFIEGDGESSVEKLIKKSNKKQHKYKYPVPINSLTKEVLKKQEINLSDIPANGKIIKLRDTANIKSGGFSIDCTEKINPQIRKKALKIATIFNLDVVGIDLMSNDISKNQGYFIEVNAYPGILLHKYPTKGKPRNIAREIFQHTFSLK